MTPATHRQTVLVVVAHPDDETFGCGSLLLHAAAASARTAVVCATRGEAGGVAAGVQVPTTGVAGLREAELRAAARALGVSDVDLLGFTDSGMDGPTLDGSLCGAPYPSVVEALRTCVERHDPDVVVTLDGSDGHRDHARIRDAVIDALAGSDVRLYLHGLPRSLMHDWVRHHAGNADAAAYVELPEIGTPNEQFTTVVDTSTHLAAREAAIALHRSQSSPYDGLPDDLKRVFLTSEHLTRVSPAWPGGPLESDIFVEP
jgi:LmbE family N-acetylglucosaminyl deacetylase